MPTLNPQQGALATHFMEEQQLLTPKIQNSNWNDTNNQATLILYRQVKSGHYSCWCMMCIRV